MAKGEAPRKLGLFIAAGSGAALIAYALMVSIWKHITFLIICLPYRRWCNRFDGTLLHFCLLTVYNTSSSSQKDDLAQKISAILRAPIDGGSKMVIFLYFPVS